MPPSEKTSPEYPSEKRRRSRLHGTTTGWVMPDAGGVFDPWEVRIRDVSRHGVGFDSAEKFADGEIVRLRIGRGPLELSRRIRIIRCKPGSDGSYTIGGEFL